MARWLTTKRTLGGKFHLTPGSDLVFAYLQPRRARRHGVDGDLVVSVDDGDRAPLTKHFQLEGDGVDASEWHRERIPLDGFGTGRVKVSFSLSANADSACLLSNVAVVEHTDKVRPSVLLITSDTHRGDYLGCAQSGVDVATPAIDALAARGVAFTNCYSTINNTNPSHSALMTGVHPRDTGIADMITPLLDAAPTLAEAFRAMGYRTYAAVSVEHLAHEHSGLAQGFDGFSTPFPGVERRAEETVAAAVEWLDGVGQEPVFLWVHVFDAHSPYNPPKEFDRRYYAAGRDPFDTSLPSLGIPREKLPGELAQLRDLEFPKAQYRSEITYLDSRLAKLLDMPRFREGVTALVGDHGESLGEHGIYFDHAGLFPQTLHVPLLIAWPGCPAGTRIDSRVQQVDLGRTLLALVGGDPAALPGRDLLESLHSNSPGKADRATAPRYMISANYTSAAIEDGESFLILVLQDPQDPHLDMQRVPHSTYFFDLAHDPECKNEVLDANMDRARALRSQLITWLEQRRSLGWAGDRLHDAKFLAQLKQLGYFTTDRTADEPLWTPDDCDWCKRFK
jgi:arylsulfatase A-like enzyme